MVNDIGSGVHYQAPFANAEVGLAYSNHVTLYTTLQYQGYDLDWQNLAYNDVRVMAGLRLVPDGQNLLEGESLDSLFARLKDSRLPVNSEVSVSGGYSWFGPPDLKMVTLVGGPFFDQAIGQEKNGDGSLNGWRTDARFSNLAQGTLPWVAAASFGCPASSPIIKELPDCITFTAATDCAIANIADFSSTLPNNRAIRQSF